MKIAAIGGMKGLSKGYGKTNDLLNLKKPYNSPQESWKPISPWPRGPCDALGSHPLHIFLRSRNFLVAEFKWYISI